MSQHLKSSSGNKEDVWRWLPMDNSSVIPSNNMMHECKQWTMVGSLQIKVTAMRAAKQEPDVG